MTFGHGSFDRLGYAAETLVFNATTVPINSVTNTGSWVKTQFIKFYDDCYFDGTPYEIDEVLKIVQIASPSTTKDSDTHSGQTLGKTYRWAVRYRYRNKNDNTKGYDNMTFVLKQSGEFSYSKNCGSLKRYMFLFEGKASAGSATTPQTPFFTPLSAQGGSSQVVYSWQSHGTGGCIGAPAIGTTSKGSGAWEIHKKQDHTVGGVSKPWRLTTYNCQTGAMVSQTYYTSKSLAETAGRAHVQSAYATYKPVDCEVSSWSSWSSFSTCVGGKQSRTRTRTVEVPAARGGKACPKLEETDERSCTVTDAVACTVSEWSEWSEWAACVDGKEIRTRTREITRQPAAGGQECPALTETEERDCTTGGTTTVITPLAGGTTPATPAMPTWAVPAGIGAVALVAILALK